MPQVEEEDLVVKFSKPFVFENKTYTEVDLRNLENLNGEDLGILWVAPWTVDISGKLRQGENTLSIEVVNLWQNRMVGDLRGEPGKRRTYTTWNHYTAEDPLLKSGLLGPVRVVAQ